MFHWKYYIYVALFVITTVKCITNFTNSSSINKSSVTVVPENILDSTLKPNYTEESLSSIQNITKNENDVQTTDRNIMRKLSAGRRELIIYQYDDVEPRRYWQAPRTPVLRSRSGVIPKIRSRGGGRPVGRNGVPRERIRRHRTKEKKKTARVLLYKEYDDDGQLINNVTMRDLDDVAKFFYVYLDVLLCYDECEGINLPTNSTTSAPLRAVSAKNIYYEVKEYFKNGSYTVVESSTQWL